MITFRKAQKKDISSIVAMLADDKLGKRREDYQNPLPEKYYQAFQNIDNDPNQELMVIENEEDHLSIDQLVKLSKLGWLQDGEASNYYIRHNLNSEPDREKLVDKIFETAIVVYGGHIYEEENYPKSQNQPGKALCPVVNPTFHYFNRIPYDL